MVVDASSGYPTAVFTPRDVDVGTAPELADRIDSPARLPSPRSASQRRAMQAAMAAAVRAMRTPGVRSTAVRTPHAAGRPPTEA